jgi:hypothetical protein
VQGSSSSVAPRETKLRTIEVLIPVSSATMYGPSPSPSCRTGAAGVTSRARSRPIIGGSAAISSRASASLVAPGKTPPSIAPASRMWRTSARVSTPVIPTVPCMSSQSSQPRSALGASDALTASRMIAARACTRPDSFASALTP